MHFLMFYEFVPDYLQRRGQFRANHLQLAWQSQQRGELILGGPFADPVDGAALLFQAETEAIPRAFAESDPYVLAGLVTRWYVRPWTTVVGEDATTPVHSGNL